MATWVEYRCHKIVKATPITDIGEKTSEETVRVLIVGNNGTEPFVPDVAAMAEKAHIGDYAVIYSNGYRSVSPKDVFEEGYTAI